MNKLGINLWNWAPGLSDACCGLPTKAAEMGFTALELPMTQPAVSPTLRDEVCGSGLEVSLCAAMGAGRDLSSFDADVRAATMQYLTDCLQTGAALGAVVLAGPLYAGGGKRHTLPPAEAAREWELAVTGLQELARRAKECGIRLALEPLNRYRTSVINTVEQLLPLLGDWLAPRWWLAELLTAGVIYLALAFLLPAMLRMKKRYFTALWLEKVSNRVILSGLMALRLGAAALLNVGLDLLFILAFHWGVAGAAFATVTAQLLSTVGCFLYAFRRYPQLRLTKADWRFPRHELTRHLIQGVPLGLQFSVLAVGIIVMQSVVVQFDTRAGVMVSAAAQNGFGAATKLNNLLMTPLNGLGAAMTSFTAQNLGAGDSRRIRQGTLQSLLMAGIMALAAIGLGLLCTLGGAYLRVFLSADKITGATVLFGNRYLYVDLAMYPFLAFIFAVRNCVQGIGKPQFILGAGTAELAARVLVCLFVPAALAGGAVSADAPTLSYLALCAADPVAWMAADTVLLFPFLRNILRQDYRYFYRTEA